MLKGTGTGVYPGIACGRIFVLRDTARAPQSYCGAQTERRHFDDAVCTAKQQLCALLNETKHALGENEAMIFDVQLLMLEDADYLACAREMIASGVSAPDAALESGKRFAAMFSALDDPYMKARAADILDVSHRVHRILCGCAQTVFPDEPFIAAAQELSPSDTVQLPREKLLGFITRGGSVSGHTAILARTLGIPGLVCADLPLEEADGKEIILDGTGTYWLCPDENTKQKAAQKQKEQKLHRAALSCYKEKAAVTKSGRKLNVFANIGFPADACKALEEGAEGIGLMRSEFLYLGRQSAPCEEELYRAYRSVAETMSGRAVIIRTLDAGADKPLGYLGLAPEENPALGLRGIRVCLEKEELFKTQLRAVYRASPYGDVRLMFPMITSLWELTAAKNMCRAVRDELAQQGIAFRQIPIGIMIETPAAALMSAELAPHADFFSIGTNDLTQYTLAADRQNESLGRYRDAYHPAVLRLLAMTAENAHRAKIPVGICGTLAADPHMTQQLICMGFDEISVAPNSILPLKKIICESEAVFHERV